MGDLGLGRIETARQDPRLRRKLAWWLLLVLVLTVLNYGSRVGGGKPPEDALYRWEYAIGGLFQFLIILGVTLLIARGMPELLALRRPRAWKGAAGMGFVILVAVFAMTAALAPLLNPGEEQGLTPDTWDASRAVPFFANAIVVCVIAPFVEETTFRGVGYSLLAGRFGVEPAIVGSALAFGLAHGLVEALPFIVALGIGLAWLRERQGSTIPGMILHATFNAIGLAASLLA